MSGTIYDIINILPLSLLSVMIFGRFAEIPEGSVFGYALCLVFSVWITFLKNMKPKDRLRSIGIVSVFTAGLSLAAGEERRQLFVGEYYWAAWVICFCAGALIVGILMNRSIWIKRIIAAALFAYCIVGTILDTKISKPAFSLICFVLLVRTAEEIQERWKKSGCPDMKDHITRVSPFLLAICIAVCMIPAPDKPYGWQFAKDIYFGTVSQLNRIYGLFAHTSDEYGSIGFSDDGSFVSKLYDNDKEVLYIRSDDSKVDELRLVGCIGGDFRGREWVFDTDGGINGCSRMADTIETSCAARKYAGFYRSDYIRELDLHCETQYYNTRYIFSPAKIRLGITAENNPGISERGGSIVSDKRLNYGDSYRISCYVPNHANPRLKEFLTEAQPITEDEWRQAAAAEGAVKDCTFEDYQAYRKSVYENYCRPCEVSEEVGAILDKIKDGAADRYETAKRLERFLNSFEYSTDCGALPDYVCDGGSFLDYFLLNSRKGYCMHFATAFVLMANEMGIPCRYVQGYAAERSSDGNFIVRESDAHAWAEVYFDNAGWVAFEPTPGYSVPAGWAVKEKDSYSSETKIPDPNPDFELDIGQYKTSDTHEEHEEEPSVISPLIFIIPLLAVAGFLLMFSLLSRSAQKKKYRKMDCREKFRYLTQQNLRLLGYLGLKMNEGETLSEFAERIEGTDSEEIKKNTGFIEIYETVLYSDREIDGSDVLSAEEIHRALRELVKKSSLKARLRLFIGNR
ncbi:MAG: transglutaminase domain-containing protein [Ruminococcus sp.]|nr:transglutaminase domain-containing protein [Ruminococcus sp.]